MDGQDQFGFKTSDFSGRISFLNDIAVEKEVGINHRPAPGGVGFGGEVTLETW